MTKLLIETIQNGTARVIVGGAEATAEIMEWVVGGNRPKTLWRVPGVAENKTKSGKRWHTATLIFDDSGRWVDADWSGKISRGFRDNRLTLARLRA